MGLGGQTSGLAAFPLPFLAHTAKSASVMCQIAHHCRAGQFQHCLSPLIFVFSPGKCPLLLSESLAWLFSGLGQGDDQHQHCQHFEPSLFRKAMILPTLPPCPP